ncbi:integrase-like protein [Streptomyces avidinii]|nr:integrase-like protein [Streptomyces avidinii]SNX76895.1 Integrase core domain-containing protein [Streptomyces microflavus]
MSLSEVSKETGLNWRTVSKYLSADSSAPPRRVASGQPRKRVVDEVAPLIDAMLRAEVLMKDAVIHERLAMEYGFTRKLPAGQTLRAGSPPKDRGGTGDHPRELAGMHRRFEVTPGAQAQVDWGDEGKLLAHLGIPKVHSFHMVLSYSRDPFCCFTTSLDLQTFFEYHRRAFAHLNGVSMTIVYDRTKTVVRRHVAPGEAHPHDAVCSPGVNWEAIRAKWASSQARSKVSMAVPSHPFRPGAVRGSPGGQRVRARPNSSRSAASASSK